MDSHDFVRFGEKLRALRNGRDLTLIQLARHLGYKTHSHLSDIETGKKSPTVALVLGVARFFSVTTDVLLRDELDVEDQQIEVHCDAT